MGLRRKMRRHTRDARERGGAAREKSHPISKQQKRKDRAPVCKLATMRIPGVVAWVFILTGAILTVAASSAQSPNTSAPAKIIIDTDIGDDVDDAFAVALALKSPEVQIVGITTTFGDTETRAKLVDRMLGEAGRTEIPVAAGKATQTNSNFTQRRYAESGQVCAGGASGCGGFHSGADSEKSGGDNAGGDWAAGECGRAD